MWYWHDGPDGWAWLWMILMMALVWLPILALILWAMRATLAHDGRGGTRAGDDLDAREVARRSYARGDISRERFLQIIEDLERTAGTQP